MNGSRGFSLRVWLIILRSKPICWFSERQEKVMSSSMSVAVKQPLSKKSELVLSNLRKLNFNKPIYLLSWTDVFSVKPILKILLPYLHVLDIIHIGETCRQLYIRFYGTSLKKILCPLVYRDLRAKYKASPLKYLSKHFKLQPFDRNPDYWLVSERCIGCNAKISRFDISLYNSGVRVRHCYKCWNHISGLKRFKRKLLSSLDETYGNLNKPRIGRIVNRILISCKFTFPGNLMSAMNGDYDYPEYDPIGASQTTSFPARLKASIQNQISCLDLLAPVVTVHWPKLLDMPVLMFPSLGSISESSFAKHTGWLESLDDAPELEISLAPRKRDRDYPDLVWDGTLKFLKEDPGL